MTEAPTAPTPESAAVPNKKKKPETPRDAVREVIETIVFVVVLVLLLKLFVTEAFVIPTGSMAETLYGYQKIVTCEKCGIEFPVNSHDEVELGSERVFKEVIGYHCPNCRHKSFFDAEHPSPPNQTGDRVLVLKPLYHLEKPHRGDVVVFKYPVMPQEKHTAANYIKRAMGFGGETIVIYRGELYVSTSLKYPADQRDKEGQLLYPVPEDPKDLWRLQYTYHNSEQALKAFEDARKAGFPLGCGFEIVRKTDDQVLACKRIVWDNDHQPAEFAARGVPPRWKAETEGKWKEDDARLPREFKHTGPTTDWLRYHHLINAWTQANDQPELIDNFLGYNAGIDRVRGSREIPEAPSRQKGEPNSHEKKWVGDLTLECEAEMEAEGEITLELSHGSHRYQAAFTSGQVTIRRVGPGTPINVTRPTKMTGAGKYQLRFADVDCRLRVWVNNRLIDFGSETDYSPTEVGGGPEGPTEINDRLNPAGIACKNTVTIRTVKLYRDIYYTSSDGTSPVDSYYVQPGHYLCLGDNSAQSSDGRAWGLVPERLMLGKAVFVFWPVSINAAKNRVGIIK